VIGLSNGFLEADPKLMQAALIQHHCREVGSGFCMERGGSTWRQEESVTEFLCAYGAPIMRYLKRKEVAPGPATAS
jgi:hypothetical protein